jgi:hypothetical protein
VSRWCRGILVKAMIGDRVDLSHPAVAGLLESRGVPAPTHAEPEPTAAPPTAEPANDSVPLTQGAMIARFGTVRAFYDFERALGAAADRRAIERKNEILDGRLISREFVRVHIFGAVDYLFRRLLTDAPRALASGVMSLVKSGGTMEELFAHIVHANSSTLSAIKTQLRKAFAAAPADTNPSEVQRPDPESRAMRVNGRLVADLITRMQTIAAPAVVETTLKAVARAHAKANATTFADAYAARDLTAEKEAIEQVGLQLARAVDAAVSEINLKERLDAPSEDNGPKTLP